MSWVIETYHGDHWQLVNRYPGGAHAKIFDTREEAEAKYAEWVKNGRCVECGEPLNDEYMEPVKREINERQLCFSCLFWTHRVEEYDHDQHVVVNGNLYSFGRQLSQGMLGHGGRVFHVQMDDGELRKTNDLWDSGCVPEHFRDRLPDTGRFV